MQALLSHVAGVDVHKEKLAIHVLIGESSEDPQSIKLECLTFTEDLLACGQKLLDLGVKHVAMESTGIYWKPVYNVWHKLGLIITLGNASHMRNVPGRKTDMKDSQWIATLHRCGLIRPSYIADEEFQELRGLNRHRSNLVNDSTRVKNRIQKVLEDGNIKLGSVVSDVFGVLGLNIIKDIAQGITDANELLGHVKEDHKKRELFRKSLTNCLNSYHCFLIKELLRQWEDLQERMLGVEDEIKKRMTKHSDLLARLMEVPGISERTAHIVIAEATTKMDTFKDERMFAAWAGVAPGNHESAGKKKESKPGEAIPF